MRGAWGWPVLALHPRLWGLAPAGWGRGGVHPAPPSTCECLHLSNSLCEMIWRETGEMWVLKIAMQVERNDLSCQALEPQNNFPFISMVGVAVSPPPLSGSDGFCGPGTSATPCQPITQTDNCSLSALVSYHVTVASRG